jgi:hypothetical protein
MNLEKRPTFDEIIQTFKAAHFRIVPRVDEVRLRAFVDGIERWEANEALAQSKSCNAVSKD